ncbi:four helix bundle protein [candidate division WOR-3 bacterium]|nr:four helix bundle protein [candidate division WOR-3 bacterium]
MRIEKFEEIQAWQEARELTKMIYRITKKVRFQKDFGLRDQIRRSSVSIMANIAEGFGRESNKEFIHFLSYASSSNIELQSHLYVALDQKYIANQEFNEVYTQSKKVGKLINGFVRYLKGKQK